MFGVALIFTLAVMGGLIAFIGDKLGYKLGKRRLSIFGLRPKNTSTLMAVFSGIAIAALTLGVLSIASNDVRTALFGMDKLKAELESMGFEVEEKNKELVSLQAQLDQSSQSILLANQERDKANLQLEEVARARQEAYVQLAKAQLESANLQELSQNLQEGILALQEETRLLEVGLITLREGNVAFRAGQVVYSGILRAGQNEQETINTLSHFLSFANNSVANLLGLENNQEQLIFVSQADFNETIQYFLSHQGQIAVRLQAAGNILAGEAVMVYFDIHPNQLIYEENQIIYSEEVPEDIDRRAAQAILINFLSRLNSKVVAEGILPDPITGNVGNLDLPYMMEVMQQIGATPSRFTITAVAREDIYTLGPLQIDLIIRTK